MRISLARELSFVVLTKEDCMEKIKVCMECLHGGNSAFKRFILPGVLQSYANYGGVCRGRLEQICQTEIDKILLQIIGCAELSTYGFSDQMTFCTSETV